MTTPLAKLMTNATSLCASPCPPERSEGSVPRMKTDHSDFMVLAFQPYDEYRKSILGVDREKALVGEGLACMDPALVST